MYQQDVVEVSRAGFSVWSVRPLAVGALAIMVFTGCGQSRCDWPEGTGYITAAKNRPASPHDVKKTTTVAQIEEVSIASGVLVLNGEVEYRESRQLFVFPGARIAYMCKEPDKYEMDDYNGDPCVLPYGITVRVDEYGQFIPIGYNPQ